MSDKSAKNYYIKNKPLLMKNFGYSLKIIKDLLLERFDDSKSEDLINQMKNEYEKIITELPDIGGKKNFFISILTGKASLIAVFRILEKEGYSYREIGEFSYRFTEIETKNGIERAKKKGINLMDLFFNDTYINSLRKHCVDSQKKEYPYNWVMKFVDGSNEDFTNGFEVSECGIHKVYKKLGAEKYAPFACILDYAQANVLGFGLTRTKSLANGALGCDHRYYKTGSTPVSWPPDNLKEYKKKFE